MRLSFFVKKLELLPSFDHFVSQKFYNTLPHTNNLRERKASLMWYIDSNTVRKKRKGENMLNECYKTIGIQTSYGTSSCEHFTGEEPNPLWEEILSCAFFVQWNPNHTLFITTCSFNTIKINIWFKYTRYFVLWTFHGRGT